MISPNKLKGIQPQLKESTTNIKDIQIFNHQTPRIEC